MSIAIAIGDIAMFGRARQRRGLAVIYWSHAETQLYIAYIIINHIL